MKFFRSLLAFLFVTSLLLPLRAQDYLPPPANAPIESTPATSSSNIVRLNPQAALVRLQLVLDELAKGDLRMARLLAEDSAQQFGNYPELAAVLAYLQQREGETGKAAATLNSTVEPSALTREYSDQLRTGKRPVILDAPQPSLATVPTASATSTASAGLPQSDARLTKFEQLMAEMVNAERRKAGLEPLVIDSRIADIARAHSVEMRDKNYFAHESPTASQRAPLDRYRAVFGQTPRMIAENVYRVYSTGSDSARRPLSQQDVRDGHEALMKSPGHRANIIEPRVTRLGIGIVTNARGDMWITQLFVRP